MDARLTLLLCVAVLEATVRLTDAAAAPEFTKPSAAETKNVDENSPVGTVVYTVEATDADGDNITYSFHGTDSKEGELFAIDPTSGEVTVKAVLDFEDLTDHSYDLKFVATAGSDTVDSVVVTVNITDVNEAPVFPQNTITEASVNENSAGGTTVCTVTATDPDDGNTMTYSLTAESDQHVVINADTGEVTVKDNAVLDHEATPNTFNINIVATDNGSPQQTATSGTITVTIKNVDEAPVFSTTSATVEVSEGATAGIHTLPEATDPEGENVTYSVDEQYGITYTIDPTTRSISADPAISLSNDGNEVIFKASDQNSMESTYTLTLNVKTEENGSVMLGVSTGLLLLMATCASILA